MSIPKDIVVDVDVDIFAPENLKSHPSFTSEDRMFLPNMSDNHIILEFTQNNNYQRMLKINSFIINFDENIT
jgi:hypothetical protein